MAGEGTKGNPLKAFELLGKGIINSVLDNLLEKDILQLEEDEQEEYREAQANAKAEKKARVLLNSLTRKARYAGQVLASSLLNSGEQENNDEKSLSSASAGSQAMTPKPMGTLKLCSPKDFQRQRKEREAEIYPVKEKEGRTRLALIICNIEFEHLSERTGAELDIERMKILLEELGYSVDVLKNLTSLEMESALKEFAARPEHKSSDSTFVVFMSHGILDGICGKNHHSKNPDVLAYDTIFRTLNTKNCLNLKDKPKVIIIQACRGVNRGHVWVSDSPEIAEDSPSYLQVLEEDSVQKTHLEKDFITFCSSTPHNVSWRDIENGSVFITELIHCFQQYSWCCHIEGIFRKVQNAFETPKVKAQMPTIERLSMTRYFYLFPGN
ncbi:caspase-13-like [Dromiciops gliroides]|uniref:caspase-13-like n=1 Tax=Dromiciops gliroides TaxID=33562 RepID=UPI001CC653DF|nr:caspase-13-like [Dromiciops gliroides]